MYINKIYSFIPLLFHTQILLTIKNVSYRLYASRTNTYRWFYLLFKKLLDYGLKKKFFDCRCILGNIWNRHDILWNPYILPRGSCGAVSWRWWHDISGPAVSNTTRLVSLNIKQIVYNVTICIYWWLLVKPYLLISKINICCNLTNILYFVFSCRLINIFNKIKYVFCFLADSNQTFEEFTIKWY